MTSPCPYRSLTEPTAVRHASVQRTHKGEDAMFVHEENGYRVFVVSDGHQGTRCVAYIKRHFWPTLKPLLPALPSDGSDDETFQIRKEISKAMIETFRRVDEGWYSEGRRSGATLTVALLAGRLLTVANVGDSVAYVHDGEQFLTVTKSHRLDDNPHEKLRLEKTGVRIAPLCASLDGPAEPGKMGYGPLRVWPGGLAVSRSIGDADVSRHVWCIPHLHQLMLPTEGARLVLASDGLWDSLPVKTVKKMIKNKSIHKCAGELADRVRIVQGGQLSDDISIIVVDVLSIEVQSLYKDFKYLLKHLKKQRQKNSKQTRVGHILRSWSERSVDASRDQQSQQLDHFLANIDGITFVPEHLMERNIQTSSSPDDTSVSTNGDFTVSEEQRLYGILYCPQP